MTTPAPYHTLCTTVTRKFTTAQTATTVPTPSPARKKQKLSVPSQQVIIRNKCHNNTATCRKNNLQHSGTQTTPQNFHIPQKPRDNNFAFKKHLTRSKIHIFYHIASNINQTEIITNSIFTQKQTPDTPTN